MEVMSKQKPFRHLLDRLRPTSDEVSEAFHELRRAITRYGTLDAKQRELCLIAGFTATRNEGGYRVHCTRAAEAGATLEDVKQATMLMLGSTTGLGPVIESLGWAEEEFAGMQEADA